MTAPINPEPGKRKRLVRRVRKTPPEAKADATRVRPQAATQHDRTDLMALLPSSVREAPTDAEIMARNRWEDVAKRQEAKERRRRKATLGDMLRED